MKKIDNYCQILTLLKELKKQYPTYNIGRHLSMALADYRDLWGVSDKEILFALTKYETELEMDNTNLAETAFVDRVIADAQNLETILDDEYEEED